MCRFLRVLLLVGGLFHWKGFCDSGVVHGAGVPQNGRQSVAIPRAAAYLPLAAVVATAANKHSVWIGRKIRVISKNVMIF
jgi:hypothetical protein